MHQPDRFAMQVLERIFRLRAALDANRIDPVAARVCLILTVEEAFAMIDLHRSTDWVMRVNGPPPMDVAANMLRAGQISMPVFPYNLEVSPTPGRVWATLWGVTLIVDDIPTSADTHAG